MCARSDVCTRFEPDLSTSRPCSAMSNLQVIHMDSDTTGFSRSAGLHRSGWMPRPLRCPIPSTLSVTHLIAFVQRTARHDGCLESGPDLRHEDDHRGARDEGVAPGCTYGMSGAIAPCRLSDCACNLSLVALLAGHIHRSYLGSNGVTADLIS